MFTIEQITAAHSKVKSGNDFPMYIHTIKNFGVLRFETKVINSQTSYFGADNFVIQSTPMYDDLPITTVVNKEQFSTQLKAHQQGKTDYFTFCNDCATTGIEKWIVDLTKMICTYYDVNHNEVLVENIPTIN
ncbi:MAG: DUF1398 family protein [Chitinophagales bacterium]|nr:DUF1398 family protein [Chitinophagales bacterium]